MRLFDSILLINRVIHGEKPSIALNEAVVGIDYKNNMDIRTFFDGYGDLRFCTEQNVLINPDSDKRLTDLIEITKFMHADSELLDLLSDYSGKLEELYSKVYW